MEARAARAYRDELDDLRERALKADKLENEVGRYRERLHKIEFYKAKVEVRPLLGHFQMTDCVSGNLRTPNKQVFIHIFTFARGSGVKGGQQGVAGDQRGAGGPTGRMENALRQNPSTGEAQSAAEGPTP